MSANSILAPNQIAADVSHLTRYVKQKDAPLWWGIIGLIIIELSVVSAFTVSYFYLQMTNHDWPPAGIPSPDLFLPTLNLVLLLSSCVTMYLASKAIDSNRIRGFVIYTFVSVAMACGVLAIRWVQFQQFDVRWDGHVYGSLLWTVSGFHFTHVVSAAIGTFVIGCFGVAGFFDKRRQLGVAVDTMYWNFVAIAWIPFYLVLYWAPRIFQ